LGGRSLALKLLKTRTLIVVLALY